MPGLWPNGTEERVDKLKLSVSAEAGKSCPPLRLFDLAFGWPGTGFLPRWGRVNWTQ